MNLFKKKPLDFDQSFTFANCQRNTSGLINGHKKVTTKAFLDKTLRKPFYRKTDFFMLPFYEKRELSKSWSYWC